jgi:hypothetical protein
MRFNIGLGAWIGKIHDLVVLFAQRCLHGGLELRTMSCNLKWWSAYDTIIYSFEAYDLNSCDNKEFYLNVWMSLFASNIYIFGGKYYSKNGFGFCYTAI